jgi:hypothetical protein
MQVWAEKIFGMYRRWAEKQGCKVGLIEKIASTNSHAWSVAMEIESEYMFGILSGEIGMDQMIYPSLKNSCTYQVIMFLLFVNLPEFIKKCWVPNLDHLTIQSFEQNCQTGLNWCYQQWVTQSYIKFIKGFFISSFPPMNETAARAEIVGGALSGLPRLTHGCSWYGGKHAHKVSHQIQLHLKDIKFTDLDGKDKIVNLLSSSIIY